MTKKVIIKNYSLYDTGHRYNRKERIKFKYRGYTIYLPIRKVEKYKVRDYFKIPLQLLEEEIEQLEADEIADMLEQ